MRDMSRRDKVTCYERLKTLSIDEMAEWKTNLEKAAITKVQESLHLDGIDIELIYFPQFSIEENKKWLEQNVNDYLKEEFCPEDCPYYDEDWDGTIRKEKECSDE